MIEILILLSEQEQDTFSFTALAAALLCISDARARACSVRSRQFAVRRQIAGPTGIDIYTYIYIYIRQSTPLPPDSRWLLHSAVTYVQKAQRGAYTWWKGLNSIKRASRRAQNTCSSFSNALGSHLEEFVFDSFLTHFWSQNFPFERHYGILHVPKRVSTVKTPKTTCSSIPDVQDWFWKNAFLTHF